MATKTFLTQYNPFRFTRGHFPVKDYESMHDLLTNFLHLLERSKKEMFMRIFNEYLNKYIEEPSK